MWSRRPRRWCRSVFAPVVIVGQSPTVSPIRRVPDGRPDLQGVWQAINAAQWDLESHEGRPGIPPGFGVVEGDTIPYQPWALAKKGELFANRHTADPVSKCFLPGVPRATYMGFPLQIVQTPAYVTILYEYAYAMRLIPLDGSPHPDGLEFWMGDSRGRFQGDTLVVDVTNFNDATWFDGAGNFHSEALHVVERYTLISADTITYEARIEDPKTFTRPWTISMPLYRRKEKNIQLLEYACHSFPEGAFEPPPARRN